MGSGTGEMTSIIADQVGEEGQVIGVDPDQERNKVAAQKHRGATADYAPEVTRHARVMDWNTGYKRH